MFRKGVAPGFEPEISSPGKKEQIFGKNPPVAALASRQSRLHSIKLASDDVTSMWCASYLVL